MTSCWIWSEFHHTFLITGFSEFRPASVTGNLTTKSFPKKNLHRKRSWVTTVINLCFSYSYIAVAYVVFLARWFASSRWTETLYGIILNIPDIHKVLSKYEFSTLIKLNPNTWTRSWVTLSLWFIFVLSSYLVLSLSFKNSSLLKINFLFLYSQWTVHPVIWQ